MKSSKHIFLLFSLVIIISCSKQKKVEAEKVEAEKVETEIKVDKTEIVQNGSIISVSPFQIRGRNGKPVLAKKKDTGLAGLNLMKPDIKNLYDKDLKILEDTVAILVVDYPNKSVGYKIHSKNGFTKTQIATKLNKFYTEIYGNEYNTAKIDTSIFELHRVCVFKKDSLTYLIPNCEW